MCDVRYGVVYMAVVAAKDWLNPPYLFVYLVHLLITSAPLIRCYDRLSGVLAIYVVYQV